MTMSSLLQKIKLIFDKLKTAKVSYERHIINPKNDWMILLTTTFIVLCIMVVVSFYFYTQIDQGKFFMTEAIDKTKEIKIDTSLLKKTVDDINLRENLSTKIRDNRPNIADPSL